MIPISNPPLHKQLRCHFAIFLFHFCRTSAGIIPPYRLSPSSSSSFNRIPVIERSPQPHNGRLDCRVCRVDVALSSSWSDDLTAALILWNVCIPYALSFTLNSLLLSLCARSKEALIKKLIVSWTFIVVLFLWLEWIASHFAACDFK